MSLGWPHGELVARRSPDETELPKSATLDLEALYRATAEAA
jgi:hypothetical protein